VSPSHYSHVTQFNLNGLILIVTFLFSKVAACWQLGWINKFETRQHIMAA
jgi:hypothetical protein